MALPVVVHRSEAYRSLSLIDRAVLFEIIAAFNGYNNGKIAVSQRQISDALGNSNFRKIGKSIATLMERGLLDIATEGLWKERKAREYRLTFITSGAPPYTNPASNEYLHWRKTDADDASARNGKSADTVSATPESTAADASASPSEKPQKCVEPPISSADTVSSLILEPYEGDLKSDPMAISDSPPDRAGPLAVSDGQVEMWALPAPVQPPCEQCGAAIVSLSKNGLKRFCGEPCRKTAERLRARQRKRTCTDSRTPE